MLTTDHPAPLNRHRYQGLKRANTLRIDVSFGTVGHIALPAGAVVSITDVGGGSAAWLTALSPRARDFGLASLEVPPDAAAPLPLARFDTRPMAGIAAARDADLGRATGLCIFDKNSAPGALYVLRAQEATELFVIAPLGDDFLTAGGGGQLKVTVKPPETPGRVDWALPEPFGRVIDEWRVSRGTAKAYTVRKGQFVQVIDVEGQQCSDFMAMRASALDAGVERYIDSTVSRTMSRSAYPVPGMHDKFFDQDMVPLLSVRQDTVGRHDTFALACTAWGYEERGYPGHVNCSDNISEAYAPFGIAQRRAWPAINFFFNSWIDPGNHTLTVGEAWSRPGDYIVLEALTDLVCVSTACPDDLDPINGWNPTDVHVRVYDRETPISHAVSWRASPNESARMTTHTPFQPRTAKLTSSFHVARDLWLPVRFDATGTTEEYWACKRSATLQDMSGLRKFDVIGPDAQELLQHCLTRDIGKLADHRGFYALICDMRGTVIDDGTLFRLEETAFRWCCGSEMSGVHLREQAAALGLNVRVLALGDRMPNLAIQGPKSRDILRDLVFTQPSRPALDNLKWFGFTIARLRDRYGPAFMLTRSGFTGELGYEIFCDRNDAVAIWDALIEAGEPHGLVPMGGAALEMLRIEAGLMISGAEFSPQADAMEAGLGFAVDFKKPEFLGRAALERSAASVRRRLVGLKLAGNEVPHHGNGVFLGRAQVGTITSATFSPELGSAIAMARVAIEDAAPGSTLEVGQLDGHMKRLPATVVDLPFIDPKRTKARA